ncbi:FAD-dependent oxidoreductase [Pseudonocardia sp. EC080625-04]|uniref:FAD-dependent oxidoreductase n=1 Tax=Pseudonocardia sp. EC080625-04 TaxID=1096868 RepID=UPI001EE72AA8|nr:FAD-dependent oxidoreductase [Pseudonocardia sp. EC080625-04]
MSTPTSSWWGSARCLPDTRLAARAGLRIGETGGIVCDASLRTSAPDVFAAGDISVHDSVVHGRRRRTASSASRRCTVRSPTAGPTLPTGCAWSASAQRGRRTPSGSRVRSTRTTSRSGTSATVTLSRR